MKTLLIVEDEKAIRMGLQAIVKRAPVEIENVLACRNGAEAFEILKTRPVDVMITDIRMPKMDGIELMRKAQALASPPLTAVISGYDDFSYAVQMLRQGVRDYILKPVDREQIFELLQKLALELEAGRKSKGSKYAVSHVLRSLMLGAEPSESEIQALTVQYGYELFAGPYVAVCVRPGFEIQEQYDGMHILKDMEGHQILLIQAETLPHLWKNQLNNCSAGISQTNNGLLQLRTAYCEGVRARRYAFVHGAVEEYANLPVRQPQFDVEVQLEQIVQLLGASDTKEAQQVFRNILFLAQNGKMDPDSFADCITKLLDKILDVYGSLLPVCEELRGFSHLWQWDNAFEYHIALCDWMEHFSEQLRNQHESKEKIHCARMYLQENFRSDINMATVSNYISMNYTQFSSLFKQYTGSHFLEYMKNLRLEESKKLLYNTGLSIREVSQQSGFKNEKHFMKSFKQYMGVSPSDYRRNIQRDNTM